jgi:hypothetical protein
VFLLTGTASIEKFNLFFKIHHTVIVMTFKKYSIKSHYKGNKLVRIIKFSHFKQLSDNLNMKKTTKVFFLIRCNFKFQKTESRADKTFFV